MVENYSFACPHRLTSIVRHLGHFALLLHGRFLRQVSVIRHIWDNLWILLDSQRFRIICHLKFAIEERKRLLLLYASHDWCGRTTGNWMRPRKLTTNLRQFALILLEIGMIFHIRLDFRIFGYSFEFRCVSYSGGLCFGNMPISIRLKIAERINCLLFRWRHESGRSNSQNNKFSVSRDWRTLQQYNNHKWKLLSGESIFWHFRKIVAHTIECKLHMGFIWRQDNPMGIYLKSTDTDEGMRVNGTRTKTSRIINLLRRSAHLSLGLQAFLQCIASKKENNGRIWQQHLEESKTDGEREQERPGQSKQQAHARDTHVDT